jgi:hypothetical protein
VVDRYLAGARVIASRFNGTLPPGTDLLFLINREGTLQPATTSDPPAPQEGDTVVLLT